MLLLEIVSRGWFAWTCAGLCLVIAACSVFREPLGIEALMLRLNIHALANQAHIIKTQERLIETQKKIIENLTQQLRMTGIIPWHDPLDDESF